PIPMAPYSTLAAALEARATSRRGIVYIAGESSETRVPYTALRARALGILRYLQDAGARPGTETVILVDGLIPFVDTFWACVLGGVVAVPLAPGNADEHKAKLFRVVERLRAPVLATERRIYDRLRAFAADAGYGATLDRVATRVVFLDEIADVARHGVPHPVAPDDVAMIQFSSGSTSEPKGVMLTHANLTANIAAIVTGAQVRPADSSLSWMPLTHDMGLIGFHLSPLCADVNQWLMPTALFVRRPALWLAKAAEHRVTVTSSPNFGYQHYLKGHDNAKVAKLDLSALRIIFNGAEPVAADLCRAFTTAMAPAKMSPDVMFPVYGLAEASLAVTFPVVGSSLSTIHVDRRTLGPGDRVSTIDASAAGALELVCLGTPVQGCELRIGDGAGSMVPTGTVGRILIRGTNVSRGYYDDSAATAVARTDEGWLDTGDLGALHNGQLVVTGRIKEVLFVAGQNHYPQDIELVLARHAGVEAGRAVATGVRPPHAATDDLLIFVLARGDDLTPVVETARTIRRVVNEHVGLAVAAVIPVRQFPKTTSGKIQRYALARDFEAGHFDETVRAMAQISAAQAAGSGAVDTELEQALLAICQAALPGHQLRPDDNLFELGTGSLTLAQIYEKIEGMYPGHLEVTDFFEYPTVRTMAAFLAQRRAAAAD
ncbi:MAG: non-ribosomal peptide synthetase, partial [Casimicrobiaceae bacterium]